MSSLHPARLVDEGKGVATTATTETPAPARGTSRRRTGTVAETIPSTVPSQRQGTASPTETTVSTDAPAGRSARGVSRPTGKHAAAAKRPAAKRPAAKRPAAKAATAAGSLAAKAKAATAAAAASTTAKAAAGKAASARTAAAKAATAGAATARTAAARVTTAAKAAAKPATARPAAAAKPPAKSAATAKPAPKTAAAAKPATKSAATPATAAKSAAKPVVTAPEPAAMAPARPTPYRRTAADAPVTPAGDGSTDAPAPAVVAPGCDAPVAGELQAEPAEVVPALAGGRRSWLARTRIPAERRRPAFYLAAGLIGAMSMGMLVDTDPAALAETTSVSSSVSVAEQLGIEAQPTETLTDPESTRVLQELVVSRRERDAAQVAAADAQAAADYFALAAAIEAARPKAVAPVNGARLTSGFGARWGTLHAGVDLAAPMRTPEYAAMDGIVLEAGPASGFGLVVYIQHDNGDVTVYGHMDEILVEAGQVVRAGDTIALVGNRGQSTGPHLHFEVRRGELNGPKIDPQQWLRERGVQL